MTRTFLVDLDTGSDTDFLAIAEEIQDALELKGMVVNSVKPWAGQQTTTQPTLIPVPHQTPPINPNIPR